MMCDVVARCYGASTSSLQHTVVGFVDGLVPAAAKSAIAELASDAHDMLPEHVQDFLPSFVRDFATSTRETSSAVASSSAASGEMDALRLDREIEDADAVANAARARAASLAQVGLGRRAVVGVEG